MSDNFENIENKPPQLVVEPNPQPKINPETLIAARLNLEKSIKSGASWFYWIAGLSLINSIIIFFGGQWNFVAGLGITQIIDAFSQNIGTIGKIIGLIFNLIVLGIFCVFGYFAVKMQKWAFITGSILYGLDALIFLPFMDLLTIGFHIFAIIMIIVGMLNIDKLNALNKIQPSVP